MIEAIEEIKRLAEEFADARYEEAKDQDHGGGKADTEYCRAEVVKTRAALHVALDRLEEAADQARDAERWRAFVADADWTYASELGTREALEYVDGLVAVRALAASGDQPTSPNKEQP